MNKKIISSIVVVVSLIIIGFVVYDVNRMDKEIERMEKERAAYEARPDMPVELSYRAALLGSGVVVSFKNLSDRHLSVVTSFTNPTLQKSENYRLDLAPHQIREVGHMEGWAFSSGDLIKVTHNDYKVLSKTVP